MSVVKILRLLNSSPVRMNFYNIPRVIGFNRAPGRFASEYIISRPISKELLTRVKKIETSPYKQDQFQDFLSESQAIFREVMPDRFHRQVEIFQKGTDGVILIDGLPCDSELPDTPSKGGSLDEKYKKYYVSEACVVGVASLLKGDIFNFRQEAFGQAPLVDNVVPVAALKKQKGAGGSDDNFPFHTESGFHRLTPNFLLLKGVRQDHYAKAETLVTEIRDVLCSLSRKQIDVLRQPIFKIGAPDLYLEMHGRGIPLGTEKEITTAVVFGDLFDSNNFQVTLNFNNMRSDDSVAMEVLQEMNKLLYKKAITYKLRENNMVVLDNNYSAHTRNGYQPEYDGKDRWLQRVNVRKGLWDKRVISESCFFKKNKISKVESAKIHLALKERGYIDAENILTSKFSCLENKLRQMILANGFFKSDYFDLKLTPEQQDEVFGTLLEYGPVYPNRIV